MKKKEFFKKSFETKFCQKTFWFCSVFFEEIAIKMANAWHHFFSELQLYFFTLIFKFLTNYSDHTLETGINVGVHLLFFEPVSKGYILIKGVYVLYLYNFEIDLKKYMAYNI